VSTGVEVEIVCDAVNRPGFEADAFIRRVLAAVARAGPSPILGIGAFVWNEPEVRRLVWEAAERTPATIVLGGPQISYVPKGGLEARYPDAHVFVRGQGEHAMIALATDASAERSGVHRSGNRDLGLRANAALDGLPSPHLSGILPPGTAVRWETQRGCPFACSFCQHREHGGRPRRRVLSEDRVLAEARLFAERGVRRLSVLDPIFHADTARATRLLREFRRIGLAAEISLQCRFELIDVDFLDAAADLDVALEFGLQTAIESEARAIRRPNNMDRIAAVLARLTERELRFEVSLIYGLPTQTLDSFRRSVDWCQVRGVDAIRAWPLMLLRGTPLDAERDRWGLVEPTDERIPVVIESDSFTAEEHAEMARVADALPGLPARDLPVRPRPAVGGDVIAGPPAHAHALSLRDHHNG